MIMQQRLIVQSDINDLIRGAADTKQDSEYCNLPAIPTNTANDTLMSKRNLVVEHSRSQSPTLVMDDEKASLKAPRRVSTSPRSASKPKPVPRPSPSKPNKRAAANQHSSPLNVAHVSWSDVTFHGLLGGGSFCSVFKVRVKNNKIPSSILPKQIASSQNVKDDDDAPYFALKCLSDCALQRDRDYAVAALDLAFEAKLLSQLRHENIVTLYGTNYADNPGETRNRSKLILILGLLEETLQQKLVRWRAKKIKKNIGVVFSSSNTSSQRGSDGPSYRVSTSDVVERIQSTAVGIACGMAYLAKNNIVLRDLKPDNVGYDASGTIKLFDFGLAQFQKKSANPEMAGSLRYMAPENGLKLGCDVQSDVYSFGILLWELCTLKKPYSQLTTIEAFKETVFKGNHRPPVKELVSRHGHALPAFIQECWDEDRSRRPTFVSILNERLPKLIEQLNETQNMSMSRKTPKRRSTFGSNRNISNHSTSSNSSDGSDKAKINDNSEGSDKNGRRRGRKGTRKQRTSSGAKNRRSASLDPTNIAKAKGQTDNGVEEEERGRPVRAQPNRRGLVGRTRSLSASFRRFLSSSTRNVSSRRRQTSQHSGEDLDAQHDRNDSGDEEAGRPAESPHRRRGVRRSRSLSASFRKFLSSATNATTFSSRRRRESQPERSDSHGDSIPLGDNKNSGSGNHRSKLEESETRYSSLSEAEDDNINKNTNEHDISRNRRSVTRGLFRRMSMESPGVEIKSSSRLEKYRRTQSTDLDDI